MGYVNGNLNLTVSADLSGVADKPTQDEILGLLQDADGDKLMLIKNILSSQNDSFVALVSTINAMQNDLNTVKNNITESGINIDSAQNIKDALTNAGIVVGDNATLQEIIASLDKSIVNPQDLRNALSALGVSVSASDNIPQLVAKMASIVTLASGSQDANATASQVLSGYSAYVKGTKVNGSVPSLGAQTITPGTTAKTIPAGRYLSGLQTIAGDGNLAAGNIKKGVSIFGVTGSYEGEGKVLEGTVNITEESTAPQTLMNISNVPFTPKYVILYVNKLTETNLTYGLIQEGAKTYQYTQFVIPYNKKVLFTTYQSGVFIHSEPTSQDAHYAYFTYANNTVTVHVKKCGSGSYSCKIRPTNWSYIILG